MKTLPIACAFILAVGFSFHGASFAQDAEPEKAWTSCIVDQVATFSNRVHVRCANLPAMPYFAAPTSNSAESSRLVTLGSAALTSGKPLHIEYKIFVFASFDNYESWGCLQQNCRRALSVLLVK